MGSSMWGEHCHEEQNGPWEVHQNILGLGDFIKDSPVIPSDHRAGNFIYIRENIFSLPTPLESSPHPELNSLCSKVDLI